jgi:hypothetical protein
VRRGRAGERGATVLPAAASAARAGFQRDCDLDTGRGWRPSAIGAGDLNGDGRLDLVTANAGTHNISLLLNGGGGHFTPKLLGPVGTEPNAIAVGDLKGDGRGGDVAVTNGQSNTMTLFRRDTGSPTGYQPTTLPTGESPVGVAIGDLNGDGLADLAVVNRTSDTLMLFLNNGNDHGFTTTTMPTPGDPIAGSGPVAVAIGDLTGHGPRDIAVADGNNNTVTLFLKNSDTGGYATRQFLPAALRPRWRSGDLGGHGPGSDLVVKNVHDNIVTILLRDPASANGYAAKALETGATNSSGSKNIVIGDVHGLGLPIRSSTRPFPGVTLPDLGAVNQAIDRLRHCLPGLALANRLDQSVIVFTKNMAGNDFTRTTVPIGAGPVGLVIGDLTGSGKLDLATVNEFSNDVTLLTNTTQTIRFGG